MCLLENSSALEVGGYEPGPASGVVFSPATFGKWCRQKVQLRVQLNRGGGGGIRRDDDGEGANEEKLGARSAEGSSGVAGPRQRW